MTSSCESCLAEAFELKESGDIDGAVALCSSARCQSVPDCQRYLGWVYAGRGEWEKALTAYLAALALGSQHAQQECAQVIANVDAKAGRAAAVDLCASEPFNNFIECERFLVRHFFENRDTEKLIHWSIRVAAHGTADDMLYAGLLCHSKGDVGRALHYFVDALSAGNERAAHMIGDAYFYGLGVPEDLDKSLHYYAQSAANGFIYGKIGLLRAKAERGGLLANLRFITGLPALLCGATLLTYVRPKDVRLSDLTLLRSSSTRTRSVA